MAPDDSDRNGPQTGGNEQPPVPVGVQRLLRLAAVSEDFLAELEENPEQAAWAAGVTLSLSEQVVLRSISSERLRHMASRLIPGDRPKQHGLPPPFSGGIRPDIPPERPLVPEIVKGVRPTPVIATAAAALLIGGAAVAKCTGACDHLVGSDEPSASEPDDPSSER